MIPAVLLLSRLFGITGVWLAVPCAEALTFLVFLAMLPFCFRRPQKRRRRITNRGSGRRKAAAANRRRLSRKWRVYAYRSLIKS